MGKRLVCDLAKSEENHRRGLKDRQGCHSGSSRDGGMGAHGLARVADQFHAVDPDVVLHGRGEPFHSLIGPRTTVSAFVALRRAAPVETVGPIGVQAHPR